MKIKDCMSRNVVSVGAQEPVSVAARLMSRYNLGFLPVQGENGRLCGVLTDRDVVRAASQQGNRRSRCA